MNEFIRKYQSRIISKWIILTCDLLLFFLGVGISILFLANPLYPEFTRDAESTWYYFVLVGAAVYIVLGPHRRIVRQTGIKDINRILVTAGITLALFMVLATVFYREQVADLLVVLFLGSCSGALFQVVFRLVVKAIFSRVHKKESETLFWIFGAGTAGQLTFSALINHSNIAGFIDDNQSKQGKYLNGIKIFSLDEAALAIAKAIEPSQIILSIQNISGEERKEIITRCIEKNLVVKAVPRIENWIHGELTVGQIKDFRIEDLLGRDEIQLDGSALAKELSQRTILVTGAAGSIGSELAHQIIRYQPAGLILLDQAETPLFELENEINSLPTPQKTNVQYVIGDVSDSGTMRELFERNNIDIIFHAAAYKHVPLMEKNPKAAILVNVLGTKTMADLAEEFEVAKFIFISTDKAVNPTNVMGASKRAAEIYIQSKNRASKTMYITTRFGNVLGSNGSVIPLFRKQIESGGPVTVTHPEITRYFMTIPEACHLVLEAGSIGQGGEIFLFDMGESVKIQDLAKKMVRLSGLVEGKDIEIVYTGLRPGEKLYEELLFDSETSLPTHHSKILISKVQEYEFDDIRQYLTGLGALIHEKGNNIELVKTLKQIVPEFISNNSEFQKLDAQS